MLLIEILLVMKLEPDVFANKAKRLGISSAMMIIVGYFGDLAIDSSNQGARFLCWVLGMAAFAYIVFELLFGLKEATEAEEDEDIQKKIRTAQVMTIASWCTYPLVYLIPMFQLDGSTTMVALNIAYSVADVVSKCGVGFVIYQVTYAKSKRAARIEAEYGAQALEQSNKMTTVKSKKNKKKGDFPDEQDAA